MMRAFTFAPVAFALAGCVAVPAVAPGVGGKPIGEFQLIQLKLATMEVARMNVQNLIFRVIALAGAGKEMALAEASACKLYCAGAAVEVALEAVQLFGGNGYMAEFRVEQLARDAKVLQIYGGTALAIRHRGEVMRERLGTTRLRSGDVLLVEIPRDRMGLDIGEGTVTQFAAALKNAGTIVWNGPMGVFEKPAFAAGTMGVARAVAASGGFSVIGGGDTIAAVQAAGVSDKIGYISTAGGAFLEFLEGRELPGIVVLREAA